MPDLNASHVRDMLMKVERAFQSTFPEKQGQEIMAALEYAFRTIERLERRIADLERAKDRSGPGTTGRTGF
jgi:hypothetical protein